MGDAVEKASFPILSPLPHHQLPFFYFLENLKKVNLILFAKSKLIFSELLFKK